MTYLSQAWNDVAGYFRDLPDTPEPETRMNDTKFLPGALPTDTKPHRKPANSCATIRQNFENCIERSPCFQQSGNVQECMHSLDPNWVGEECLAVRKGYHQCRRDLLNRQSIWQRGNKFSAPNG